MAAARAERTSGNFTVFHSGVYTACAALQGRSEEAAGVAGQGRAHHPRSGREDDLLRGRAPRILRHSDRLDAVFLRARSDGQAQDRRADADRSHQARFTAQAVEVPYYWALAPDYDVTLAPMITTKQGPLLQGEFRQRLINGAYSIRGAGIYQLDKGYFTSVTGENAPGYRDFRGSIESTGPVRADRQMGLGLGRHRADRQDVPAGLQPESVALHHERSAPEHRPAKASRSSISPAAAIAAISTCAASTIYGFSNADAQGQIPVIHPVLDYNYTFDHPVLGGELGYDINLTSLTRQSANFDAITQTALNNGSCLTTAAPGAPVPANCLLRGIPGTYSRFSAETHWRRSITDSVRPGVHAVRLAARRCRLDADQQRSGRRQLHRHRRHRPRARHADGRPRIPLSASSACSPGARRRSSRSRR